MSMFVDLRSVLHASEFSLGASAIAGRISEPRDVVSDFRFAKKRSFLRLGRLTSGDFPLVHTHTDKRTTVILV